MHVTTSVDFNRVTPPAFFGAASTKQIDHRSSVTRVERVNWDDLDSPARTRWVELRQSQPEFSTPFFSLGFFDAVHAARGDVQVAMLYEDCRLIGMLPIHIIGKTAFPAGRFFNDAHNVVMADNSHLNWVWMLQQLGLRSYNFHALVGQVATKESFLVQETVQSFRADLSNGSEVFLRKMESEHATLRKQQQKTRKMSRELGEVTLELDCRDENLLQLAIAWKRKQYKRTKILDLFTPDWTRDLMWGLHQNGERESCSCFANSPTRGLLSVLRAGHQVVAMHFGMVENGLLHYWFPVYDPTFSKYSPGTALFKEIAREAEAHGIHTIDMGYGEQPYKRKQTDRITSVRQGCVSGSKAYLTYRQSATRISNAIRCAPMKSHLKWLLRSMKPTAGISKIQ